MKMIVIVMVIIFYWFLLGTGISFLLKDTLLVAGAVEGNKSINTFDTSNINMTTLPAPSGETSLRTFINTLKIMFGFRTPVAAGLPNILAVIISFINWFLFIIGGVAVYRLVNPLAAP